MSNSMSELDFHEANQLLFAISDEIIKHSKLIEVSKKAFLYTNLYKRAIFRTELDVGKCIYHFFKFHYKKVSLHTLYEKMNECFGLTYLGICRTVNNFNTTEILKSLYPDKFHLFADHHLSLINDISKFINNVLLETQQVEFFIVSLGVENAQMWVTDDRFILIRNAIDNLMADAIGPFKDRIYKSRIKTAIKKMK